MLDVKIPEELKETQYWFGRIIERPIDEENRIDPIAPSGEPLEVEAARHIAASATLRPMQRIEIYNQQYWWRLLNALQETFPLMIPLIGYRRFNREIAIPYLLKYPSIHWSVVLIGDRLVQWMKEEYHGNDRELLINMATVDWAFNYSFIVEEVPPLTTADMETETISSRVLHTQPHLALFKLDCDLFKFRQECQKHPNEYWTEHPLPDLYSEQKTYFFVLYRNHHDDISWKEISMLEYHLLSLFQNGTTIDQACEWLEQQEASLIQDAEENLQKWFQEWTARGWLV